MQCPITEGCQTLTCSQVTVRAISPLMSRLNSVHDTHFNVNPSFIQKMFIWRWSYQQEASIIMALGHLHSGSDHRFRQYIQWAHTSHTKHLTSVQKLINSRLKCNIDPWFPCSYVLLTVPCTHLWFLRNITSSGSLHGILESHNTVIFP